MRRLTYKDILAARTPAESNRASLVRAHQQVRRGGPASFGLVSAYRDGATAEDNRESHRALCESVRGRGYGGVLLHAHWTEATSGQAVTAAALFIPGISLAHALELGHQYEQPAVVYAGPEHGGKVALHIGDVTHTVIGRFPPGRIAAAYAGAMGREVVREGFYFEGRPGSWVDAVLEGRRDVDAGSRSLSGT